MRSEPDAHEAASSEILRIRAALHHREHDGPHPVGASAVLAPLVPLASGLHVLFERRPPGSSFFSGHLSFPGGRMESRDPTPLAAALRETWEEVGIRPDTVEVLGHLDDARDPFGRRVSCYVGTLRPSEVESARPSAAEVDEVLLVPLADLREPLRPRGPDEALPRGSYRVLGYEGRTVRNEERVVHYWSLQGAERQATLWGFTAGLVGLLLARVYGWSPPAAPRVVERWQDLQP